MMRFPPRKILVPLDDTEASAAAWRQAEILCRRFGAGMEGVYVQRLERVVGGAGIADSRWTPAGSEETLRRLKEKYGVDRKIYGLPGEPAPAIVEWVQDERFDFIVMGTHGRTGLSRALLGSVSEAVVRRAPVPVLIVRRPQDAFRSVLVPVNFMPYSYLGLAMGAKIAAAYGSKLRLLSVVHPPVPTASVDTAWIKGMLKDLLAALPPETRKGQSPEYSVILDDPARGIVSAGSSGTLTVIVAHQRGLLSETVIGTTAERVARFAQGAVLTVPSPGPLPRAGASELEEIIKNAGGSQLAPLMA